jgi:hypothetical protein
MRPHKTVFRAALLAAGLALPLAAPASANVLITIDKGSQRMLVQVDGATRYEWPVSTGRPGFDTPNGTFRPNRMEVMHYSNAYEDAPMPHSIFFDLNGHAIHGFSDTPHLGMAVSHGCVRLSPANAATLYDVVKAEGMANTTVIVRGRIPARGTIVARREAPREATYGESRYGSDPGAYADERGYSQNYGRPAYQQQQAYGRSYEQQAYGQQGYYARPAPQPGYYDRPAFPPQPAPVYGRPAYGQPYGGQAYYGGYPQY